MSQRKQRHTRGKPRKNASRSRGKLIVIDGIDGSGKATQTKLLSQRLERDGIPVQTTDFPHYDNFFGEMIGDYLAGRYGDFIQTDPRIASVLYAADRYESSAAIREWLASGVTVIIDRYVSANQIHQGGKIRDSRKRRAFVEWLEQMEHEVFGIPRPDLVIYLDVPLAVSQEWVKQKSTQRRKTYLKGRRDLAEDDTAHLRAARNTALWLARRNDNWEKIQCCRGRVCLPPEEVHEHIMRILQNRLSLV